MPLAKPSILSHAVKPRRADAILQISWWPATAASWMGIGFLVALVLSVLVLATFGVGSGGTIVALRVTARWCFVLFWPAYAGAAASRLFGARLAGVARRGRELGLGFASAQVVHVTLVVWLIYIGGGPGGRMIFFWVGILFTYLLALISLPQLRNVLGVRLWRVILNVGLEYIALVFAADFIIIPLQVSGFVSYPLSYVPFALMLLAGVAFRLGAFARQHLPAAGEA
jgi:hypothetical protein